MSEPGRQEFDDLGWVKTFSIGISCKPGNMGGKFFQGKVFENEKGNFCASQLGYKFKTLSCKLEDKQVRSF